MKKMFLILIAIFSLLALTSCPATEIEYPINEYIILNDKLSDFEYSDEYIIYSYNEFKKIEDSKLNKYNEEYFQNNSLIVITFIDNINNKYAEPELINNVIKIKRLTNVSEEKSYWTIIIEIKGKHMDQDDANYEYICSKDHKYFNLRFEEVTEETYHFHKYNKFIKESTCIKEGYIFYQCKCTDSYIDMYLPLVSCEYIENKCIWCNQYYHTENLN